jgi:hypothetical protein
MKTISIKVTKDVYKQIRSKGKPKHIVKKALLEFLKNEDVKPVKTDNIVNKNIHVSDKEKQFDEYLLLTKFLDSLPRHYE